MAKWIVEKLLIVKPDVITKICVIASLGEELRSKYHHLRQNIWQTLIENLSIMSRNKSWNVQEHTRCPERGQFTKKNAWVWHLFFWEVHTPRYSKKAKWKYSMCGLTSNFDFSLLNNVVNSKKWHFSIRVLGSK